MPRPRTGRPEEVKAWLVSLLADGPRPATEIQKAAAEQGINARVLRRYRVQLGIIRPFAGHERAFHGGWLWTLPPWWLPGAPPSDQTTHPGDRRSFGAVDGKPPPNDPPAAVALRQWLSDWQHLGSRPWPKMLH